MNSEPTIILSGTDPDLPRDLPTGLGRYSGFREMARGGSAQLRACFDPVTGRTIAIKSLLPQMRYDRRERRRLLREARVTAQLQHPNTVPVYDIGDDPSEGIYFTMKRISGENLFEILKRIARGDQETIDAFPVSRRLGIVLGACQALSVEHLLRGGDRTGPGVHPVPADVAREIAAVQLDTAQTKPAPTSSPARSCSTPSTRGSGTPM